KVKRTPAVSRKPRAVAMYGPAISLRPRDAMKRPVGATSAGPTTLPTVPPSTTVAMALARCARGVTSAATKRPSCTAALPEPETVKPSRTTSRLPMATPTMASTAPTAPVRSAVDRAPRRPSLSDRRLQTREPTAIPTWFTAEGRPASEVRPDSSAPTIAATVAAATVPADPRLWLTSNAPVMRRACLRRTSSLGREPAGGARITPASDESTPGRLHPPAPVLPWCPTGRLCPVRYLVVSARSGWRDRVPHRSAPRRCPPGTAPPPALPDPRPPPDALRTYACPAAPSQPRRRRRQRPAAARCAPAAASPAPRRTGRSRP